MWGRLDAADGITLSTLTGMTPRHLGTQVPHRHWRLVPEGGRIP
jgi:hypothetical protein